MNGDRYDVPESAADYEDRFAGQQSRVTGIPYPELFANDWFRSYVYLAQLVDYGTLSFGDGVDPTAIADSDATGWLVLDQNEQGDIVVRIDDEELVSKPDLEALLDRERGDEIDRLAAKVETLESTVSDLEATKHSPYAHRHFRRRTSSEFDDSVDVEHGLLVELTVTASAGPRNIADIWVRIHWEGGYSRRYSELSHYNLRAHESTTYRFTELIADAPDGAGTVERIEYSGDVVGNGHVLLEANWLEFETVLPE